MHLSHRDSKGWWSIVEALTPPQIVANGRFGASVVMQGSRLLISQPGRADGDTHLGAVHCYRLSTSLQPDFPSEGRWILHQTLTSPAPQEDPGSGMARYFGGTIPLDGDSIAISEAVRESNRSANHNLWEVATFRWDEGGGAIFPGHTHATLTPWQPDTHLTGLTKYPILGGISLAGSSLAVANSEHLSPEGWRTGAVRLFQRGGTGWQQQQVLTPDKNSPTTSFGDRLLMLENSVLIGEFDGVREYHHEGNAWVRGSLMSQERFTPDPRLPSTVNPLAARGGFVLVDADSRPALYHRQGGQLNLLRTFPFLSGRMRYGLTNDTAIITGSFLDAYLKVSFFTLKDFAVYPGSPPEADELQPYAVLPAWSPSQTGEVYPITLRNTGLTAIAPPAAYLAGTNYGSFTVFATDAPAFLQPGEKLVYYVRIASSLWLGESHLLVAFPSVTGTNVPNTYHLLVTSVSFSSTTPEVPNISIPHRRRLGLSRGG